VSSAAGTDFTFGLGEGANFPPILGILPLYGEVAVIPQPGSENGVYVIDGPTQMGVRLQDELDRDPLRITVKDGRVQEIEGDPEQVQRLRDFIASGDPPADVIDEVGIVTTQLQENDDWFWTDGTHHHDCVHIALGNNERKDVLVHGPRHMDGEVQKPTIRVGDQVVVKEGVFQDHLLDG
jgi:leucyl aminopeptidase (aminopeptidase T)